MCYHVSENSDPRNIAKKLGKKLRIKFEEHKPRYHVNGFDNPLIPVIAAVEPDTLHFFRWRFIPDWVKDPKKFKANTLNAKSEEIFQKLSFKNYWQNRCLIVCDGFFEPHVPDTRKPSQAYYIRNKKDEPLTLGGIYSIFEGKPTCCILTTTANLQMAQIHNEGQRMPVILDERTREEWLKPNLTPEKMISLCQPYDKDLLAYRTIDSVLNSRIFSDLPSAILPFDETTAQNSVVIASANQTFSLF